VITDISVAILWWEEYKVVERWYKLVSSERDTRFNRVVEMCRHLSREFCNIAYTEMYLATIGGSQDPLLRDANRLFTRAKNIIDFIIFDAHLKKDPNLALKTLLSLPRDFRIHYIENIHEPLRTWLRELLGDEVVDVLKKTRVELKIVLDVEDAVKLIQMYGSSWREKARELLKSVLLKGEVEKQ
jgi:hypothetical protein